MAVRSPERPTKQLEAKDTAKFETEAKKETKEQSATEIGKQRMEHAKQAVQDGVGKVKEGIGKALKFIGDKAVALLAPDILAKKGAKAAGEFVKKDYQKTKGHVETVGKAVKDFTVDDYRKTVDDARKAAEATRDFAVKDYQKTKGHVEAAARGIVGGAKIAGEVGVIAGSVAYESGKFIGKKAVEGAQFVSEKAQQAIESATSSAQKAIEALQGKAHDAEKKAREHVQHALQALDKAQLDARRKVLGPIAKGIISAEVKFLEMKTASHVGKAAQAEARAKFYGEHGSKAMEEAEQKKAQELRNKAEKTLNRMDRRQSIRNLLEQFA